VQPVALCKQAAAHYTCRQGIALKTWLWRIGPNRSFIC
jgi:hypothetical protein